MKTAYLILLLGLFSLLPANAQGSKTDSRINMEDSIRLKYNYTENGGNYDYTLLEFGSHHCIPCKMMDGVLDSMRTNFPRVKVCFVDVAQTVNTCWLEYFHIDIIPQQIVLDKRGKLVFRHEGYIPYNELVTNIKIKKDHERD